MSEQNKLDQVASDTATLLQQAGQKTTQSVIQHTEKYHETYTTIDKIVDSFWERIPYLCIAVAVFLIFWLLTKVFKLFIDKTLTNRSYTDRKSVV